MIKHIFSYPALVILAVAFTAAGCANGESVNAKTEMKTAHAHKGATGYKKPGAAIDYVHNYDGTSQPGDIENITLTLTEPYEGGTLALEISEDPGLILYTSSRSVQFNMSGAYSHEVDLQIGMPQAGKHYLNFSATTDNGAGQISRRSFAIALNVTNGKAAAAPIDRKSTIVVKDGLVIMEAEETVTVQK